MEQVLQERRVRIIPANRQTAALNPARDGKKRVAAYCRVSTDSEEQLNSYAAQKTYYTQKIEETDGWEMAGVFADEGITGTSLKKRKEFNKMIAACKRGRIDMILTKSISRFARNTVDCLKTVRMLSANGIGIIFEKENINTLTESSEFLITLFSGFAQAESESLSKNIGIGKRMSAEAGKVSFQYKKMLGYRKGKDGEPEIVPEEAETVRRIFRLYLDGCSLGQIKAVLEGEQIPTAEGVQAWSYQVIRNILTNEKYIGDAMLLKTYITDCISKKVKRNRGERPMYYVENSHPAIIPKDIFNRVQAEMTRRTSKRKVMQKSGKTELGKYSAKYALSELLVCGECGTPYKRVTWARNGVKRIVWRCVSRLEFGTKYCHKSPTLDEEKLQAAILEVLNGYQDIRQSGLAAAIDFTMVAISPQTEGNTNLPSLQAKLNDLTGEQALLLDKVLEDMDNPDLNAQLKKLADEKQSLLEQIQNLKQEAQQDENRASRLAELRQWAEEHPIQFDAYDDGLTRKMIERITVLDAETVSIRFRDTDVEIEKKLC